MRSPSIAAIALTLWVVGSVGVGVALAADETGPAAEVRKTMDQARKLGAKGQLPLAWWDLDKRFDQARKEGADAATWAVLEDDARLLRNRAAFIDEMRKRKSGMEALLGRFDQALDEIAALYGVERDRVLSGSPAAADLMAQLDTANLHRQVLVDSLTVANRHLNETVGSGYAAQESSITALQVEVSALRRQLWETELRVGVAEADRSAAEVMLTRRQEREDAVNQVRGSFGDDEVDVSLTPDGVIILRVHAIAFGVGSAEMQGGQAVLVGKVADAVALFPGAALSVEGHTDDTGSRAANLRLSRRRAESFVRVLADRLGRAPENITAVGHGPDRPVALNSTAEGRALNRRIDVVITPGD